MSQWTHVAGCVRVDAMPFLDINIVDDLRRRFGDTCAFDSSQTEWDRCNVPLGSEGSVQYRIQRTGGESDLSWGLVYIWGDLRSYNDANEIFDWVVKACTGLRIRSCIVKVDIEGQSTHVITNVISDEGMTFRMDVL